MTKLTDPEPINWRWLYIAATLAGAGLGILVVLGVVPEIPHQLTTWMRSVDHEVAVLVVIAGGAAIGLVLAALAHLGVRWQLRRRLRSEPDNGEAF